VRRAGDRRRERAVAGQLPLVAEVLAAHVRAGRSLSQAIAEAGADLPAPASAVLARAAGSIALGSSSAAALAELGSSAGAVQLRAAVEMQARSGGDLALLLDRMAVSIRDRAAARRDAEVATAQARATGRMVSVLPVAALGMLWLADPVAMGLLLSSPLGWAAVALSAALSALGHVLIARIATVT
jgi:tight adherence protein B